jgi:peptidoglycan/LPS O-acetylase OafA/YrhL
VTELSKPAAGKKIKLLELDIVRALAILAVVLIHGTSSATVEPTEGSASQIMFYILNVGSSFAVPLFIMISGIVLFYSYDGRWNGRTALTFYRKRAVSLVIPYLIWAFFYYAFNQYINTKQFEMDWPAFWGKLGWAEWSYHSYFMLIIFQMYLLFPLFMTLVDRISWFRKWMIPLGLLIQEGFYVYRHWFSEGIPHSDRIAPTYMAYFLIGGAIGLYYPKVKAWVEKHKPLTAAAWLIAGSAYVSLFLLSRYKQIYAENTWYEVLWILYVTAAALFFMQIGRFLLSRFPRLSKPVMSIGICSFGIYLIHPAFLTLFTIMWKNPTTILMYDLYTFGRYAAVLGASWLVVYVYGKLAGLFKRKPAVQPGKAYASNKTVGM